MEALAPGGDASESCEGAVRFDPPDEAAERVGELKSSCFTGVGSSWDSALVERP